MAPSDGLCVSFQLTALDDERLEVRATAPAGEGRSVITLPPRALLDRLARHDPARIPAAEYTAAGQTLYRCLMAGDGGKLAAGILDEGRRLGEPVQFEIRLDPDQVRLAEYPWEMIADDWGRCLVQHGIVEVTRYVSYPQRPPSLSHPAGDLSILRVISRPPHLPPFPVQDLPVAGIQTLENITFEQLMEKLLIERLRVWGLQFHGHGALLLQCGACDKLNLLRAARCARCGASLDGARRIGALAFDRNGETNWISAQTIGGTLYNTPVQMVLLLSCETARIGDETLFAGLAPGLLLAGVPAVIGMQYDVAADFANSFAGGFYRALAAQKDLRAALHIARRLVAQGAWYSPVIYLRHTRGFEEEVRVRPAIHVRTVDTATPSRVQAGRDFFVRLWIRRPETRPLGPKKLREELDIAPTVPVVTHRVAAPVKFEPIDVETPDKKKLRRGEVTVSLDATNCDVRPASVLLFVDEHLDAPPAIFTVRARATGECRLVFRVWQDGGEIASVVHAVRAEAAHVADDSPLQTRTLPVPVGEAAWPPAPAAVLPPASVVCPRCGARSRAAATYCATCGASLAPDSGSGVACPQCGHLNRPGARFCRDCGTAISAQGAVAKSPAAFSHGPLPAGSVIDGRFRIESQIAHGGLGAVYRARELLTGETVEVKELAADASSDADSMAIQEFEAEAALLARLRHRNIPRLWNAFAEGGRWFTVTKFVDGVTLEQIMEQRRRPFSESELEPVFRQLCDVLGYLHGQRPPVIFGDLKPSKIRIDRSGTLVLTDFGLAGLFSLPGADQALAYGTPGYAAPEQYVGGPVDARTDIYALGVTLHHLLTGYDPSITPLEPPPLDRLPSAISAGMRAVIAGAVQRDPAFRWGSVQEMAALHRPLARSELTPPRPATGGLRGSAAPVPPLAAPSMGIPEMQRAQHSRARASLPPPSHARSPRPAAGRVVALAATLALVLGLATLALTLSLGPSVPLSVPLYLVGGPLVYAAVRRPGPALAVHLATGAAVWLAALAAAGPGYLGLFGVGLFLGGLLLAGVPALRDRRGLVGGAGSGLDWRLGLWLAGAAAAAGLLTLGLPALAGADWLRLWSVPAAAAAGAAGWFLGDRFLANKLWVRGMP